MSEWLMVYLGWETAQKSGKDVEDTQTDVGVGVVVVGVDVAFGDKVEVAVDTGDMLVAYALVCMALEMVLAQLEGLDLLNTHETVELFGLNCLLVVSVGPDKLLVHWNHNYLDCGRLSRDFVWVEVVETLT